MPIVRALGKGPMGQERHAIPPTKTFDATPLLVTAGQVLRRTRRARKTPKIRRGDLAAWVGIAPSSITFLEEGVQPTRLRILLHIVHELGLSMDDLFPKQPDALLTRLQQRIASLDPDMHAALWQFLDSFSLQPKDSA